MTTPAAHLDAPRRRDVERNERALLDAAAHVFASSGVNAPVREVAAAAGVGVATLYRHFPTRSDLVVAVYRHQIDALAEAGPLLLTSETTPFAATLSWVHGFVDFLGTKHGLAHVWEGDAAGFTALHALFVERLVPVLAELLHAAREAGEVVADVSAYQLFRAIGDLVAFSPRDPDYDVRRMVTLLVTGLKQPQPLQGTKATGPADETALLTAPQRP
ncbi:TetR/AcrR family transcriptional regulator [Frondihabitans sp. VKM Ac-2883]|uniref:TetR/AcrR family transcriptional regulator n=1 Tax=Frondihabitans sp. VKM Ac-2883 TaxID=2783823 RepID=UPI00188CE9C1|nr:TetR/AcrR family transcriptional regulator [Frondihabitans sp. VKM Ac-2883]MBF4577512.1 TetR/AcrR family transcriptional regulator [Frondihabitans sp. VKM Ac-2883]